MKKLSNKNAKQLKGGQMIFIPPYQPPSAPPPPRGEHPFREPKTGYA